MGAGRTELFETIFGYLHTKTFIGHYSDQWKPTDVKCPVDAINAGLALVPGRQKDGLVLGFDVKQIFPSPLYSKYNAWFV